MTKILELEDSTINYEVCGNGPPVLLLHGYPSNHKIWYPMVELLSQHFSCVMPDLRGYGQSKVKNNNDIKQFSKSVMGIDQISLMDSLGYKEFSVIGHDRGARVAYRLAFDNPDRIKSLTVMDIIPTYELITRFNWKASLDTFHWSLCASEDDWPETMIGYNPNDFISRTLNAWTKKGFTWDSNMVASFKKDFSQKSVIRATCQDFRCFASLDYEEDEKCFLSSMQIDCPTMVLWGSHSLGKEAQSPLDIWKNRCKNVVGQQVDSGHFLPAENPKACFTQVMRFLAN